MSSRLRPIANVQTTYVLHADRGLMSSILDKKPDTVSSLCRKNVVGAQKVCHHQAVPCAPVETLKLGTVSGCREQLLHCWCNSCVHQPRIAFTPISRAVRTKAASRTEALQLWGLATFPHNRRVEIDCGDGLRHHCCSCLRIETLHQRVDLAAVQHRGRQCKQELRSSCTCVSLQFSRNLLQLSIVDRTRPRTARDRRIRTVARAVCLYPDAIVNNMHARGAGKSRRTMQSKIEQNQVRVHGCAIGVR